VEAAELEEAAEIRRQTDQWIAAGRPGAVSHDICLKQPDRSTSLEGYD
jgi:hypothetical protein